ncbi:MAG: MTAP family purine nucleoside phosphorylase [Armatimonadota bacterium]|nr:MTAP family purine nucleoside phosphorylase [Armatimonadota bacterium]
MEELLAVIGGSQAHTLIRSGSIFGERIGSVQTPFGESQPIYRILDGDINYLFLSRHGEEGYRVSATFVNYCANIWALKELGAGRVIGWSGPGAINTNLRLGQFVLPDDVIDETKRRTYTFFEGMGVGFVRQNPVFCSDLQDVALKAMVKLGLDIRLGGTYVCTEGPRLETPAEIRKYKLFGADMVGMTLVPEVFLAKELEMCYVPICYITNYAEGVRNSDFVPGELFEGLLTSDEQKVVEESVNQFPSIIAEIARLLKGRERNCNCPHLMDRYRKRGDLGPDWHSWVKQHG